MMWCWRLSTPNECRWFTEQLTELCLDEFRDDLPSSVESSPHFIHFIRYHFTSSYCDGTTKQWYLLCGRLIETRFAVLLARTHRRGRLRFIGCVIVSNPHYFNVIILHCSDNSEEDCADENECQQLIYEQVDAVFIHDFSTPLIIYELADNTINSDESVF